MSSFSVNGLRFHGELTVFRGCFFPLQSKYWNNACQCSIDFTLLTVVFLFFKNKDIFEKLVFNNISAVTVLSGN